ncbi:MAG: hypothetical protein V3W44_10890 [Dehalococcoidales bacterium]
MKCFMCPDTAATPRAIGLKVPINLCDECLESTMRLRTALRGVIGGAVQVSWTAEGVSIDSAPPSVLRAPRRCETCEHWTQAWYSRNDNSFGYCGRIQRVPEAYRMANEWCEGYDRT